MDDDGFSRYSSEDKVAVDAHPRIIAAGAKTGAQSREDLSVDSSILGRYINDRLNSRVAASLGEERVFHTSWRFQPSKAEPSVAIARCADRILIFTVSAWVLCDLKGKEIARGTLELGEPRLDPGRQVFYAPNFAGLVAAYRLSDGAAAFHAYFNSNKEYFRSFIARRGRRLVLLSTQLHLDFGQPEPQNTILEISDLGDPANQKSFGQKGEPTVVADLVRATQVACVAIHGETIIYAAENRIYGLDMQLTVRNILTGSFVPIAISLDGLGRIYLLAVQGGRTTVSCITLDGQQLFTYALPRGTTSNYAPIVGYDHTVYLLTEFRVFAVGADGKERWTHGTAGRCSGAVVTADDTLIVGEGAAIAAYTYLGKEEVERREICRLDEAIVVAPVLFEPGKILAASATTLYMLEAAPA